MPDIELSKQQWEALDKMKNGCILCGGTGSGKTRTALAYYFFKECGGGFDPYQCGYLPMSDPLDLYIITTAATRDKLSWNEEMVPFLLSPDPEVCLYGNDIKVVVDSWNNIKKYIGITNAFFIFDEQRVVGSGAWVKAFLKITKNNRWILLSATPGDKWEDYIAVFVANGFYKNRTEFKEEHLIYKLNSSFPQVERYVGVKKLQRIRDSILIPMECERHTIQHHENIHVEYDLNKYRLMMKLRKDLDKPGYIPCQPSDKGALLVGKDISIQDVTPILDEWDFEPNDGDYVKLTCKPFKSASELCYALRRIVNSDESRQVALLEILEKHPKAIIFYNYDYELNILKGLYYGENVAIAEWNGHCHQPIPDSDRWVYLVNYAAGAEGWNCIKTDTVIFYSQNYSYKVMVQASGRIDRLNTLYKDLYYYHLKSFAQIDIAIERAIKAKKKFNEDSFVGRYRKTSERIDI